MTALRESRTPPVTFLGSLTRSQVSAGIATAVDFGLLFFLTELAHVWYVLAVAAGAFAGAVTNFLINRHWSFKAGDERLRPQAFRYAWVSASSLALNTGGVWAVTEGFRIPYGYSVVMVSLAVALAFNYPLHRYYVFRREAS